MKQNNIDITQRFLFYQYLHILFLTTVISMGLVHVKVDRLSAFYINRH